MNKEPLVSIGLPVRNGAKRLPKVLDSLLGQTYKNIELVISDNASDDGTQKLCEEYAKKDQRVRYIRQEENLGQVPNFVFVLKEARGEYFMWAADDDWHKKEFIETLLSALQSSKEHSIAMCSYTNVYSDGEVRDTVTLKGKLDLTYDNYLSQYEKMILNKPIHHFLYGLHRRSHIVKFFDRPTPQCIRWDRVFMSEVALVTRLFSVERMLFFKTVARMSVAERYTKDAVGTSFLKPFAYTRYVFTALSWIVSSPRVPFQRKMYVPLIWLKLVWMYKRILIEEMSRWLSGARSS